MDNNMAIISGTLHKTAEEYKAESYYTCCRVFFLKVKNDVIAVYMDDKDFQILPKDILHALSGRPAHKPVRVKVYGYIESINTSGQMRLVAWQVAFDDADKDVNRIRVEGWLCERTERKYGTDVVIGILRRKKFTRLVGYVLGAYDKECAKQCLLTGKIKSTDKYYIYPVFDLPENGSG